MTRGPQWIALALAACGGGGGEAEPAAPAGPAAAATLAEDPAGRLVVAEVDGRPVYADCVSTQAAARRLDRRAALDECIAFELLAAEAERRGYARHPDVLERRDNELARALIDREFAARFAGPEDVPMDEVAAFYGAYKDQLYVHPEWRSSYHVLVNLGFNKVPPGSTRDLAARRVIDDIHAALRGRTVTPALIDQVAGEARARHGEARFDVKTEPVPGTAAVHDKLDPAYRDALFALPRVGAIGPPVRSSFGWHVILLTEIHPPMNQSVAEAAPDIRGKIFEAVRRRAFQHWTSSLLPGKPQIDERLLARLGDADVAGPELAPAAGTP